MLLEFLEKYDKFGYLNERPVPLIIYDLGLSDDEKRNLPEKAYAKHQLLPFPYHIYPSFWKIEIDAGKYGWKAGIMAEVFKAQKRSVLWLDSGIRRIFQLKIAAIISNNVDIANQELV